MGGAGGRRFKSSLADHYKQWINRLSPFGFSFIELGRALQVGYSPFEIIYREFSQNTVRLPVGLAGDIVVSSKKDGFNCLTSARRGGRCAGDRMLVSRTLGAAKSAASCVVGRCPPAYADP